MEADGCAKRGKKRAREAEAAGAAAAAAAAEPAEPAEPAAPAAAQAPADHAVYAEGWPYDSTEEQIRAFLSGCGPLLDLTVPRFQDSGRLRGFVHARFGSARAVAAALALSGTAVGARFITVKLPNPLGGGRAPLPLVAPAGCKTLHVHNLPYAADEGAIKAVFQRFGNVASVRIARRSDTQASKGFAYVEFEGKAGGEAAVAASQAPGGLLVGGRPVRLDYDTSAGPRASFKTVDGRAYSKVAGAEAGSGGGGGAGRAGRPSGTGKRPNAGVSAHGE